ncbi:MAG: NADH-quinone oxidoreductase subunit N, partial [Acidobacteriota bacterium]|nr:NADH-quinone oxidoreductase subunit N [Acidobacteriota bacterium]
MITTVLQQTSTDVVEQVPTPDVDWQGLLPVLILFVGGLLLLTITSLLKGKLPKGFEAAYTVAVATAAGLAVLPLWAQVQGWDTILWFDQGWTNPGAFSTVGGAVGVDGFSLFLTVVICVAVGVTALLAEGYLRREDMAGPDLYVLLLLSATGGIVMAMANDLIVLFLGLETLSIAVYVLAAMHASKLQSQEAGLKYFVLGGFSSAFLLYGIALVYGATGSTNLLDISSFLADNLPIENGLLIIGFGLMIVGLGFKVAAVPFHSWSPDVYDGAPTPVVAFMASGVKAAGFAALIRVFVLTFPGYAADWRPILEALAVLSLVVGALLAVVQTNVKRMLAYSSISHAGFILVALVAVSAQGTAAVAFYVAAYTFMVAGTFGVLSILGGKGDARFTLDDLAGTSRRAPVLAGLLTFFLLAQAGVPFTAGFFAKFYAIIAAVETGSTWLAILAMVASVVSA